MIDLYLFGKHTIFINRMNGKRLKLTTAEADEMLAHVRSLEPDIEIRRHNGLPPIRRRGTDDRRVSP